MAPSGVAASGTAAASPEGMASASNPNTMQASAAAPAGVATPGVSTPGVSTPGVATPGVGAAAASTGLGAADAGVLASGSPVAAVPGIGAGMQANVPGASPLASASGGIPGLDTSIPQTSGVGNAATPAFTGSGVALPTQAPAAADITASAFASGEGLAALGQHAAVTGAADLSATTFAATTAQASVSVPIDAAGHAAASSSMAALDPSAAFAPDSGPFHAAPASAAAALDSTSGAAQATAALGAIAHVAQRTVNAGSRAGSRTVDADNGADTAARHPVHPAWGSATDAKLHDGTTTALPKAADAAAPDATPPDATHTIARSASAALYAGALAASAQNSARAAAPRILDALAASATTGDTTRASDHAPARNTELEAGHGAPPRDLHTTPAAGDARSATRPLNAEAEATPYARRADTTSPAHDDAAKDTQTRDHRETLDTAARLAALAAGAGAVLHAASAAASDASQSAEQAARARDALNGTGEALGRTGTVSAGLDNASLHASTSADAAATAQAASQAASAAGPAVNPANATELLRADTSSPAGLEGAAGGTWSEVIGATANSPATALPEGGDIATGGLDAASSSVGTPPLTSPGVLSGSNSTLPQGGALPGVDTAGIDPSGSTMPGGVGEAAGGIGGVIGAGTATAAGSSAGTTAAGNAAGAAATGATSGAGVAAGAGTGAGSAGSAAAGASTTTTAGAATSAAGAPAAAGSAPASTTANGANDGAAASRSANAAGDTSAANTGNASAPNAGASADASAGAPSGANGATAGAPAQSGTAHAGTASAGTAPTDTASAGTAPPAAAPAGAATAAAASTSTASTNPSSTSSAPSGAATPATATTGLGNGGTPPIAPGATTAPGSPDTVLGGETARAAGVAGSTPATSATDLSAVTAASSAGAATTAAAGAAAGASGGGGLAAIASHASTASNVLGGVSTLATTGISASVAAAIPPVMNQALAAVGNQAGALGNAVNTLFSLPDVNQNNIPAVAGAILGMSGLSSASVPKVLTAILNSPTISTEVLPRVADVLMKIPGVADSPLPQITRDVLGTLGIGTSARVPGEGGTGDATRSGAGGVPSVSTYQGRMSGAKLQYVNLEEVDDKWNDGVALTTTERQSRKPRIHVEFNRPGAHRFTITVKPDPGNIAYTGRERGRRPSYQDPHTNPRPYTTKADGTFIVDDIELPAAGRNVYLFEVRDERGQLIKTERVETARRLYVQEIMCLSRNPAPHLHDVTPVTAEFAIHGVDMVQLARRSFRGRSSVDAADSVEGQQAIMRQINTVYSASEGREREPYTLVVCHVDRLAVPGLSGDMRMPVPAGPGGRNMDVPVLNDDRTWARLWLDYEEGEDWLIHARYIYTDASGVERTVNIPRELMTPIRDTVPGDCSAVKVDLTRLFPTPVRGTLNIQFRVVAASYAGLALNDTNLLFVSTLDGFEPNTQAYLTETLAHEMGHLLGMVPSGPTWPGLANEDPTADMSKLDPPPHFYYKHGGHCYYGLPNRNGEYSSEIGQCVMYGITCANIHFCPGCAKAMRKVDCSEGWPSFTTLL